MEETNHADIIESNADYLLTETTIQKDTPHSEIMEIVKKSKSNGSLCYQLSDGSVRRIELKQKTRAKTEDKRNELRRIMGHEITKLVDS